MDTSSGRLAVSLVIPFYNPGAGLAGHVAAVMAALESTGSTFEVIAVSDGSTDGSAKALVDIGATAHGALRVVELEPNRGKGAALRAGFAMAGGDWVGFIDADGDIPADVLPRFVETALSGRYDIVTGSKADPRSVLAYSHIRRLASTSYRRLVGVLFRLPARDTQTGVKLIRREAVTRALPLFRERRFAFDLELFVICQRLGYTKVIELPVRLAQRNGSTVSSASAAWMIGDTLAVFVRRYLTRAYGRPTRR